MNFKKNIFLIMMMFCMHLIFADDYHFNNFFIGDRAASMGGAYCAIADGPEGVYYNPAGLSFSSSNYFSKVFRRECGMSPREYIKKHK